VPISHELASELNRAHWEKPTLGNAAETLSESHLPKQVKGVHLEPLSHVNAGLVPAAQRSDLTNKQVYAPLYNNLLCRKAARRKGSYDILLL
jgi:hypothetical protein